MSRPHLFLDIDGVFIGRPHPESRQLCLALHAEPFLRFALKHFECCWLSSLTQTGETEPALDHLGIFAPAQFIELALDVDAEPWIHRKTEAIAARAPRDFYWIDDAPTVTEKRWLRGRGQTDRLFQVNTRKRPNGLLSAQGRLRNVLK
jgi:hypothetical protein